MWNAERWGFSQSDSPPREESEVTHGTGTADPCRALATGEPVAAELTFQMYVRTRYLSLLKSAQALTGNRLDAEDLVQTTLGKAYLAWDRIRDKQAADAYVRRTLVNTQRSWWRRRRVDEISTDTLPEAPVSGDPTWEVDARQVIAEALGRLPRRQRMMIILRFCEDLSEAETARLLGVAVGTVKSSVSRGLAKLRSEPTLRSHVLDFVAPADAADDIEDAAGQPCPRCEDFPLAASA